MPLRITFRQLRMLRAVAEEGSFSRAAARLHLTQPTLSVQARQLEEYVGELLFGQVGRRIELTDAGREVLATAVEVEEAMQRLADRIAQRRGLTRGRLRVVATSTAEYFLPRLLGEFSTRHPGVDVFLEVLDRGAVLSRLADNAADLYVMARPPVDPALQVESLFPNPLVLVSPPGHPWAHRASVPFAEVAAQPLILREEGSGTRLWLAQAMRDRGAAPTRAALTLGSNEAIKQAVRGGLGLAVLSLHAALMELNQGLLAPVRAEGFPLAADWYLVTRRTHPLSPAAIAFLAHLREASGHIGKALAVAMQRFGGLTENRLAGDKAPGGDAHRARPRETQKAARRRPSG